MEVFTSNMTIAVIMVHSECPEMPNSMRNRERSHLLRGRIYLAIWSGKVDLSSRVPEPDWAPVVPVFLCLLRGPLHRIIPVFLPPKERKYGNFIWVGGTFIS